MQPILIIPPETISPEDVKRLNDNGICTVICKDPAAVKFLDPIPSAGDRGKVEQAAIALSRKLLHWKAAYVNRAEICQLYVEALSEGTPLSQGPTPEEVEASREKELEQERHWAKVREAQRLGREEAKAEREAKKAEQQKPKK